jgi:hypothetical protein
MGKKLKVGEIRRRCRERKRREQKKEVLAIWRHLVREELLNIHGHFPLASAKHVSLHLDLVYYLFIYLTSYCNNYVLIVIKMTSFISLYYELLFRLVVLILFY